jgi:hypothetical protein
MRGHKNTGIVVCNSVPTQPSWAQLSKRAVCGVREPRLECRTHSPTTPRGSRRHEAQNCDQSSHVSHSYESRERRTPAAHSR